MAWPVYPRWRGEHAKLQEARARKDGLSPLARGTHQRGFADGKSARFIPAGAGNTTDVKSRCMNRSVYPRWRGEHPRNTHQMFDIDGLSPLARGTLRLSPAGVEYSRFIPAGAGNTVTAFTWIHPRTVYPRWRGEHVISSNPSICFPGLSPLARGTH